MGCEETPFWAHTQKHGSLRFLSRQKLLSLSFCTLFIACNHSLQDIICFHLNLCPRLSRNGSVEEACMPFSLQHKVNILPYCSHKVLILPPALCWLICQLLLLCWWAPPNLSCCASRFFSEVNEWQAESWCSRATAKVVQEKLTEEDFSCEFSLCRSPQGSNLTTESPFPLLLTTTCLELPHPWLAEPMDAEKSKMGWQIS